MTSLRCTFIQLSQATMCPLYVSPFFSSRSCSRNIPGVRSGLLHNTFLVLPVHQLLCRARIVGPQRPHHWMALRGFEQQQRQHPGSAVECVPRVCPGQAL